MDAKTLLQLTLDQSKPVEELKACIVLVSSTHPGNQLEILKSLELWLGESILEIENRITAANETKENFPEQSGGEPIEPRDANPK